MPSSATDFIRFLDELARTRGRTTAAFRSIAVAHGLTAVENIVLTAVAGATRPPTVSQIGRSLGHPRQVIQRAADALVTRGLVAWLDNPGHKRARLLEPTAAGSRIQAAADRAGLERAATIAADLDPALIAATADGLRTIREAIEARLRETGDPGDPSFDAGEREDA